MPRTIDPVDELLSFQQALIRGEIRLRAGALDPDLYVYADEVGGTPRFTYVHVIGLVVTAYAVMVMGEPVQGLPCFRAAVAVPAPFRGKGRAKDILEAAIAELKNGLSRNNAPEFYVDAVVAMDNEAGKKIALASLSASPQTTTDSGSGLLALRYIRKF